MGLLENATQAAQRRAEQNQAAAIAHRLRCEERDLTYARQWWHEHIAEPAEFWLPKDWSPYGEADHHAPVLVTSDGWPFMFRPKYKPDSYTTPRDCLFVVTGLDGWGHPQLYKPTYSECEITDLASMGRILARVIEAGLDNQIDELSNRGYGELMLAGRY